MEVAAVLVPGGRRRQAIPPDAERLFAQRMGATTVEIASSHVAMVSHPDDVVDLIERGRRRCRPRRRRPYARLEDPGDGQLLGQRARRGASAPGSSTPANMSSTASGASVERRGGRRERVPQVPHSWDEYSSWNIGLTDGANDETKARYAFVYGDFRRIHSNT